MSNNLDDTSVESLNSNFERDYLRQIQDVEEQNYMQTDAPLVDDESSVRVKRELNIKNSLKKKHHCCPRILP